MTETAAIQSFSNYEWKGANFKSLTWVLTIFFTLWFFFTPENLDPKAAHLFAIFVATIFAIIVKPLPMGSIAIIALAACNITGTLTISQSLSSFSSKVVWLVVIAFLFARCFIKTGLGTRIAYYFVYYFGKTTIGLSYSLIAVEFLLAPFIPSNTARGAGIVFPIVTALNKEYGSTKEAGTEDKIGAYLIKLCFHANIITSAMFMTAMVANPLIANFAESFGVYISWLFWAKAAIVPGLVSLILLPFTLKLIYPPQITQSPEASVFAQKQLTQMGRLSIDEWIMIGTFTMLLGLWIMGKSLNVDATAAAIIGLSILLITGILEWNDILAEKNSWNTFIWLSVLLMMTNFLTKFGFMTWFSSKVHFIVNDMNWLFAFAVLSLIYYYSHYLFASLTAHVTSMFSAFALVAISAGTPKVLAVLFLAFISNLSASVTHYGTGTAPVFFGANYVNIKDWWRIGAIISVVNFLIWGIVGSAWWKLLNIW